MRIDFRGVNPSQKGLLPDGWYHVEVKSVQPKQASSGLEYWRVEFLVRDGGHAGARVFDNLFFSEKALPRLKIALSGLGLPHDGVVEVVSEDLVGRRAWIEVKSQEGTDRKVRNVVTFGGYKPDAQTTPGESTAGSQVPAGSVQAQASPDEEVPF
jgi:hypothetical protein